VAALPVADFDRPTVGFRNLSAEHQSYAASVRFGGVEGSEHIGRIQQAGPFVLNCQHDLTSVSIPTNYDVGHLTVGSLFARLLGCSACVLQDRVGGIPDQIDEHLLQLIGISLEYNFGSFPHAYLHSHLESRYSRDEGSQRDIFQIGLRHLSQLAVRLEKSLQRG